MPLAAAVFGFEDEKKSIIQKLESMNKIKALVYFSSSEKLT
jgi:hypothetical protein